MSALALSGHSVHPAEAYPVFVCTKPVASTSKKWLLYPEMPIMGVPLVAPAVAMSRFF